MSRSTDLLRLAAEALDDGQDPFSNWWLSEHAVTLDECYSLSEQLAAGARMMLSTMRDLGDGGLAGMVAGHRLVDALIDGIRSQPTNGDSRPPADRYTQGGPP